MEINTKNTKEKNSTREAFGKAMVEVGRETDNVYVLSADLKDSLRVEPFFERFPEKAIEVGIAEQNMAGIAAGLTHNGIIPFTTSFAVFNTGRNYDQLRMSICLSNHPVKVVAGHAGLSNAKDGANQQGTEDISVVRSLPNLKVIIPADFNQCVKAVEAMIEDESPNYLRLSGEMTPDITSVHDEFEIGKAQYLSEGDEVTIISAGPMLYHVKTALKRLNVSCELINLHTIKPIDKETILQSAKKTGAVITIEDHQVHGGLGSAVAEILAENHPTPMKIIGLQDTFAESARDRMKLYKKYGLDPRSIGEKIKKFVESL